MSEDFRQWSSNQRHVTDCLLEKLTKNNNKAKKKQNREKNKKQTNKQTNKKPLLKSCDKADPHSIAVLEETLN